MKKEIKTSIILILVVSALVVLFNYTDKIENRYQLNAEVISLQENNLVMVEDENQNIWSFYADDNSYMYFDDVVLTMDNNKTTDTVTDDIIIKVKKIEKNF